MFPVKGTTVIQLTRLNGNPIALNSDLIKFVENAPDTVITLINGERIVDFRRAVMAGMPSWGTDLSSAVVQPQESSSHRSTEAFRRG